MTSNINPNNIDGLYPVAGQDNNSQGFRDNFTNTKTNFQYAADEITDLQNKAILKAALTGGTLNNDMLGSLVYNVQVSQVSGYITELGTPAASSITINFEAGSWQSFTTNGSKSLAFTNFPAAGSYGAVTIQITVASAAHTITFPASVSVNNSGIQGLNISTNSIVFAAAGTYTFKVSSVDGGTTYTLDQVNNGLVPFNNSSESLSTGSAASLSKTVSYFSTSGASTATLAAGTAGQIKTFAMYADSGDMVITVTNAGWKTSGTGTITFDAIGDACTLQYINNKWFAIGANGVVFA